MSTHAASPRQPARRRDEQVPSITSAPEPLADDQARRMRRYLFQMGFRVVCFVGAYFASGWLRWTLIPIAVVIPYAAVILVNAGRDKVEYDTSSMSPAPPKELPALADGVDVVEHVDDPADGTPADGQSADGQSADGQSADGQTSEGPATDRPTAESPPAGTPAPDHPDNSPEER